MYSMFDLFFDTPAYRPVYVISDSEMKELQRTQNQDELEEIRHQKKRLEEAYKAQVKHLDEREKELKTELKAIEQAFQHSPKSFTNTNDIGTSLIINPDAEDLATLRQQYPDANITAPGILSDGNNQIPFRQELKYGLVDEVLTERK